MSKMKTAAPSKSKKYKSGSRHCEDKVKKTGKIQSKVTTGKITKKSKNLDWHIDLKTKHCKESDKKNKFKNEGAKKTES
jgi:hypothetical protein